MAKAILSFLLDVFITPFILVASIAIDFISIPSYLMKDEKELESKYLLKMESFSEQQETLLMDLVLRIFYSDFKNNVAKKYMNFLEFIELHRRNFKLVPSIHELFCKGGKNKENSLSAVENFNLAKILGKQASIPHPDQNIKRRIVNLQIFHNIQMDIENFNYIYLLI